MREIARRVDRLAFVHHPLEDSELMRLRDDPMGALAVNLYMAGGDAKSKEELCEGIERGVWVTRFWYVNIVHPKQSQLTGMTRDGTFLIVDASVPATAQARMRFVLDAGGEVTGLELLIEGGDVIPRSRR